jgi:hypothetical protein
VSGIGARLEGFALILKVPRGITPLCTLYL